MTASNPLIEKVITLTLGGTSFAEDCIDAELVPTPGPTQTVITLDGVAHQSVAVESWALRLKIILDHDSGRPGLAYYLNTNKGTTVAYVFNPHSSGAESAAAPKWTGSVVLQPVSAGGSGNVFAEVEVLLPCTGVPVRDGTP